MGQDREAFLDSIAADPPWGVVSNLDNPDYAKFAFPLFVGVFVLSQVVFSMKIYVQLRIIRRMLPEDYLLVVGWFIYTAGFAPVGILICQLPVGVHQWDVSQRHLTQHMLLYYISLIVWTSVAICVKVNILLQYIRIFVPLGMRNSTYWASIALICLNCVFDFTRLLLLIFNCNPRAKFWDRTIDSGTCLDWVTISVAGSAITLLTDSLTWLLPVRVILGLQIKRSRKVGLSALFALGIFALISSGLRIHYLVKLRNDRNDTTYWMGKVCFFATTQLTTGFLVASLTAFPAFASHVSKQPWVVRAASTVNTWLLSSGLASRLSSRLGSHEGRMTKSITTIGGKPRKKPKGNVVTDVEFEELVHDRLPVESLVSVNGPQRNPSSAASSSLDVEQWVPAELHKNGDHADIADR